MSGWTVIEDNHQDRHRRLEFDLDSRKAVLTVTNLLAGNVPALPIRRRFPRSPQSLGSHQGSGSAIFSRFWSLSSRYRFGPAADHWATAHPPSKRRQAMLLEGGLCPPAGQVPERDRQPSAVQSLTGRLAAPEAGRRSTGRPPGSRGHDQGTTSRSRH